MIGANKILTVSYGTFSCTLEGFDEPFTTMKAIAEYFRDLAAEDRYFGAEPPTPDAEMLHRIAEREIQRRVEAKISENAVVLRQMEPPAEAPAPVAPVVQPAAATAPAPVAPVEVVAQPAPAAPQLADGVASATVAPADEDSISDKLRRIRAVVANAQSQPAAVAAVADTAFYEDLGGSDADLTTEAAEYAEPLEEDFGFTLELDPQDLSDVLSLNAPDDEPAAEATVAEAVAEATGEEAGEAEDGLVERQPEVAKVSEEVEAPALTQEILTDEAEAPRSEAEDVSLNAMGHALTDFEPAEMSEPTEVEAAPVELSEDEAAGAAEGDGAALAAEITEADVWEAIEQAGPSHPLTAEPVPAADLADTASWEELDATTHQDDLDAAADADVWAEAQAGDAALDEDLDEAYDDDAPMTPLASLIAQTRARVERVRSGAPNDLDDDQDQTGIDEITAEAAVVAGVAEAEPEADDDLIAGIEAAIGAIDAREAEQAQEASEDSGRPAAAKTMLAEDAEDGGDFERLMEEANTKLEGAESRRRFSAISHLKAAVAATVADRILKPKDAPAEAVAPSEPEINRYRDDLSRAVRPRRPEPEGERVTARPAMPMRPAPLVLVSEQRVDREALKPATAVRPRRVATTLIVGEEDDMNEAEPLSPEDAKSFTEFAERLGARSLAELLEVAAVYTATVEGKNSFSRPHLLRRVNAATGVEDFSREDYLRSFGSLLRQGRIQKVEPGRFSVTDVSPFMTEMRRAAN